LGVSYLDNFGNWEEESIRVSSVDCCQLGRKEDQAYNKDLTTHEEPFDVVPFGRYLAEPARCLNLGFHSKVTTEFV